MKAQHLIDNQAMTQHVQVPLPGWAAPWANTTVYRTFALGLPTKKKVYNKVLSHPLHKG